ncbi:MAG: MazG nucleotide pyrophosphohydrolase domain-containing protein [Pyrinomonadaceae bacterium]
MGKHETSEAVEDALAGRPLELRDELGDLLFQIIFYAQIAAEQRELRLMTLPVPFTPK